MTFGTDGTLYIAAANTTVLHTMDETTATVTSLDNSQLGGGSDGDLAFIGSDLFMSGTNGLHRFDLTTTPPNGVTIGNTGLANLFGLATPDQSTLFGIAGTSIYSIDPTDASSTFLSTTTAAKVCLRLLARLSLQNLSRSHRRLLCCRQP